MSKLGIQNERFVVKEISNFTKNESFVKIEKVTDTLLRNEWYNVIWYNTPNENTIRKDLFKFLYRIKNKSYKNEKEAINHFNHIIKSQLL